LLDSSEMLDIVTVKQGPKYVIKGTLISRGDWERVLSVSLFNWTYSPFTFIITLDVVSCKLCQPY